MIRCGNPEEEKLKRKDEDLSYFVSRVLRNRPCTIFLSSSAGATFSSDAVLSSTRRILFAGNTQHVLFIHTHFILPQPKDISSSHTFSLLEETLLLWSVWRQRIYKRRPAVKTGTKQQQRRLRRVHFTSTGQLAPIRLI